MKPKLHPDYSVSAFCPTCQVVTRFNQVHTKIDDNKQHSFDAGIFRRVLYVMLQCPHCSLAGLATVPDNGNIVSAVLENFYPISAEHAKLPAGVPDEIQKEFREAEVCVAFGANRAASGLFRSVLEKTLKLNGYVKGNDPSLTDLQKRIDAAAADGVITEPRRKRAHDEIRSLGNDVLHDDWRPVIDEEVEKAHRYMQRILEDFYDDRETVEKTLKAKERMPEEPEAH